VAPVCRCSRSDSCAPLRPGEPPPPVTLRGVGEDADEIVVRAVEEQDLPAVARLWSEMRLAETGYRDFEASPSDTDPFHEVVARRFRDPARILLVAYRGGQAVGFYSGRMRGPVGGGLDLYVTAKARRHGVGRSLVEAALTSYRERGAERLVGALRGHRASLAFWASIWRQHPSRLLRTRSAAGVEWRTRVLTREIRGAKGSPPANRTGSSPPPSTP